MNGILIGDPHAKISTLSQLEKIIDFAILSKKDEDTIILLGDLFDTHGVVRNEISYFWKEQFAKLAKVFKRIVVIVGNHDQVGSLEKEHIHSLWAFSNLSSQIIIVDIPMIIDDILFVPYTGIESKFINWVKNSNKKIIFCHQTFDGAMYDNGIYAPDGFSLSELTDVTIISGHIHSQSEFANVWYPGTALWDSASDANKPKGIWRCHIKNSKIINKEFLSTASVVPEMLSVQIKEGEQIPEILSNKKYVFHLIGTSTWINKIKKNLSGHKIKTTFTDSILKKASEKKMHKNIEDFIASKNLHNAEKIIEYIRGLK